MRILIHANAPHCNTGYGRQAALWSVLLRELGHETAISAYHGHDGAPTTWNGIKVYPGGDDQAGMDTIGRHYRHFGADLAITLMDHWNAEPAGVKGLNVAHWIPADCEPLAAGDRWFLTESKGTPIAMSIFGRSMLRDAGFDPLYVPHGINTDVFRSPQDRVALREAMGIGGRFAIGINAANSDKSRKGFPEQFRAFAQFRRKHREALLLVHTRDDNTLMGGLDLHTLARTCGISDDVWFSDQDQLRSGMVADNELATWYGCLDVLSNCSWGEGFGLPVIEAQACGTPVVVTGASAMTELRGAGWLADGEPFWNYRHEAWWTKPDAGKIARCYEYAFKEARNQRGRAQEFAQRYDARRVLKDYWEPAIAALTR